MEYDFDQMSIEFNELRSAYMAYRQGGSQEASRRRLDRYISLSDRFFRSYPNPFAFNDDLFIPPGSEYASRGQNYALTLKLKRLQEVRRTIKSKLENISVNDNARLEKYQAFLCECEKKMDETQNLISEISTSRLPG